MEIDRISPHQLKAMLDGGETVIIIDVRAREAFSQNHLQSACNIPKSAIVSGLKEFSTEGNYVLY